MNIESTGKILNIVIFDGLYLPSKYQGKNQTLSLCSEHWECMVTFQHSEVAIHVYYMTDYLLRLFINTKELYRLTAQAGLKIRGIGTTGM